MPLSLVAEGEVRALRPAAVGHLPGEHNREEDRQGHEGQRSVVADVVGDEAEERRLLYVGITRAR